MTTTGLRVLLVLGTSGGGVGRHVRDLARSLVEDGNVVVVAGPQSVQDSLDLTATGARFAAIPVSERPSPTGDPRSVARLRRLMKGCDIVHAHGLRAGGLAALARGRSGPPPLVVTLHNALVGGGAVAAMYGGLERLVAHRADLVLGVSADLEQRQRDLGARRVGHALVAAPPHHDLRRTPAETRARLGLPSGARLVVSVARLTEQKGLPLLLDATAILRLRQPDAVVVIAGDGPSKAALQQRVSTEGLPVRLLGWRDDIPELLAAADVAVSSAVWEGQPIWIQEAVAAGTPVVATDVGGTAAVVGDAGILVPAGDANALARAMDVLLVDSGHRAVLARAALARAAELPDSTATRESVVREYRVLLTSDPNDC